MKKLLILAFLSLSVTSITVQADLFDTIANISKDKIEPKSEYLLKTYGHPVRVYEWEPDFNKDWVCVFMAGNTNSTGSACYPKSKEQLENKK